MPTTLWCNTSWTWLPVFLPCPQVEQQQLKEYRSISNTTKGQRGACTWGKGASQYESTRAAWSPALTAGREQADTATKATPPTFQWQAAGSKNSNDNHDANYTILSSHNSDTVPVTVIENACNNKGLDECKKSYIHA